MPFKTPDWSVIVTDRFIVKRSGEFNFSNARGYKINDDAFWNQAKFSNIHAIQFTDDNTDNDQVEYNDGTPNSSYDASILGPFSQFIEKWDAAHLVEDLQASWDKDGLINPGDSTDQWTYEEKVAALGPRPTSYSSS